MVCVYRLHLSSLACSYIVSSSSYTHTPFGLVLLGLFLYSILLLMHTHTPFGLVLLGLFLGPLSVLLLFLSLLLVVQRFQLLLRPLPRLLGALAAAAVRGL